MKKVYDARVAAARGVTSATAAPRFESLQTRTHGVSLFFRTKFDSPRPANRSGIVSLVDDADQHEGVTDFYVIAGGTGQMVTDGEIEHRQYGHEGHDPRLPHPCLPCCLQAPPGHSVLAAADP